MNRTATVDGRTARPEQPAAYTSPGLTLPGAAAVFVRCFSPRLIAPLVAAAVVVRVLLAGWTWSDLVVVAAILAVQPFTEWVTHVVLLHWKPRRVGRLTLDPVAARRHRAHHRDPKVIREVLIPPPVLVTTVVGGVVVFLLAAPSVRLAVTGLATSYAMLFVYEWTHFLIHSTYQPRSWYYRSIWRSHRLHHFRNENYWYGVTVNLADHVLRTFPDKDAVPVSPTARTLGVEVG